MTEVIPLFPLKTMLFPGGEIALQLFEPRYLDMVKRCMRDDSGFGVVGISSGSEVIDSDGAMQLLDVGTYARIVDWDALENGRLGITARGDNKFRVLAIDVQPDQLVVAEVKFFAAEQPQTIPDDYQHLVEIFNELIRHPSVAQLQSGIDATDAVQIGNVLAQLLPVSMSAKYELLRCTDAMQRLARIDDIVTKLGGNAG